MEKDLHEGGRKSPQKGKWCKIVVEKLLSRKFLVLILASVFVFTGHLTGAQWLLAAGVYQGINLYQKNLLGGTSNGLNGHP